MSRRGVAAPSRKGAKRQASIDSVRAGNERLGFLAHELRNLSNTAILAFEVLKTGNVGVAGNTGAVLNRSLMGIGTLIGRSLAEIRLSQIVQSPERFLVADFINEITPSATLEASAKQIKLLVLPVEDGVIVEADRQVLAAAVGNLLQNAFKFTRTDTTVTVRVGVSAERVLIEVQDECGGLSAGDTNELFRPFEQRSADRTGLGLGLPFSRWAVEANHGRVYARSLPDKGCVFTVDLPRVRAAAAVAIAESPNGGGNEQRYIDEERAEEAKEEALTRRLSCNSFRGCKLYPRLELDNLPAGRFLSRKLTGRLEAQVRRIALHLACGERFWLSRSSSDPRGMVRALSHEGFVGIPAANGQEALDYLKGGGEASVIVLD